jgi:hypothetical protein
MLNYNIDSTKCYVRLSHFTKKEEDYNTLHNVYLFGVQSISGKILTFHGMTDYGMLRSRIPLDQVFFTASPLDDIPSHFKQLWDCFGEDAAIIKYEYLETKRCQVVLKDGVKVWATYWFTIDWFNNPYSEEPSDYKCGHVLIADDGYILCQPNNRIYWKDCNWITKPFPIHPSEIKVDGKLESVESFSDKWVSEDNDCYYYNIEKTNE